MHQQVVGLFNEGGYVTEAARLLRGAGYGWSGWTWWATGNRFEAFRRRSTGCPRAG